MKRSKLAAVYSLSIEKNGVAYVYIGSTSDLYRRMKENNTKLKNGVHHCRVIQDLYNKGYQHRIELLEVQEDYEKLINTENEYMDYFRKLDGVIVTNIIPAVMVSKRVYLSVARVMQVKRLIAEGMSNKDIEKLTGVNCNQVSKIRTGYRWANIEI